MKLAIVTAVWKRPEVFRLFAINMKELIAFSNFEIQVFVSGSEGVKSREMVEQYAFNYIEVENEPLARKHNTAMLHAYAWKADYALCLGSDDLISPHLLDVYEQEMKKGTDFCGVTDFYFYDIRKGIAAYWAGYREAFRLGHTAGAARLISKRLLDLWHWQPWEIRHSKILDNSIQDKLKKHPHTSAIFSLKKLGVVAVDIKSEVNMTPLLQKRLWDNTTLIQPYVITEAFPYIVGNKIS